MLYKQICIISVTFLAFLGLSTAAKRSRGQRCNNKTDCVDGLECLDFWGDCGAECICPGDINHDLTVFIKDKCVPRLRYGQICEHNAQCTYAGGLCISNTCKCQKGKTHLDGGICGVPENRKLGEQCLPTNNWCYYVDEQHQRQRAVCEGEPPKCQCPSRYMQEDMMCVKKSGVQKEGQRCEQKSSAKERTCAADLVCRRCHSVGAYICRATGGTNGVQSSVALLLTMLVAVTLKI